VLTLTNPTGCLAKTLINQTVTVVVHAVTHFVARGVIPDTFHVKSVFRALPGAGFAQVRIGAVALLAHQGPEVVYFAVAVVVKAVAFLGAGPLAGVAEHRFSIFALGGFVLANAQPASLGAHSLVRFTVAVVVLAVARFFEGRGSIALEFLIHTFCLARTTAELIVAEAGCDRTFVQVDTGAGAGFESALLGAKLEPLESSEVAGVSVGAVVFEFAIPAAKSGSTVVIDAVVLGTAPLFEAVHGLLTCPAQNVVGLQAEPRLPRESMIVAFPALNSGTVAVADH